MIPSGARAESVEAAYFGRIDLTLYSCRNVTRSSFIQRVCHNRITGSLLMNLRGTYYLYCGVPGRVVEEMLDAPSMGSYYNNVIKGPYRCDQ